MFDGAAASLPFSGFFSLFLREKFGAEDHLQQWSVCDLHSTIIR